MKIDLFTFIAQILNFLILVILLYFFLFKKIIYAIDKREETLRNEFEKAEESKKAANEKQTEYESHVKELEAQKEEFTQKAKEEAKQEKERLLQEAHVQTDEKKKKWEEKIEREKKEFLEELQIKIAEEVFFTAETVLKDLANAPLQTQLSHKLIEVLETLSEEQIQKFQEAYHQRNKEEIQLLSAFELQKEEKEKIQELLTKILQETPKISCKTMPHYPLGISIKIDSFQFDWTTKNYFHKLQDTFEKVLVEKT